MAEFLILGGDSKLAKCFMNLFPQKAKPLSKKQCDITNPQLVEKTIKSSPHKYVLNCAAITNLELCEKDPALCFLVNSVGVYYLNKLCLKYGKKFINISSDFAIKPVNLYGWTKHLSEKLLSPKNLIIRTSFYCKESFLVNSFLAQKETKVYKNRFFNPISINRLAKEIFKARNGKGIKNIASSKKISFYSFAKSFCQTLNLDKKLIKPTIYIYKNAKGKAERPLSSFIKPDIKVDIKKDLKDFKTYLEKYAN